MKTGLRLRVLCRVLLALAAWAALVGPHVRAQDAAKAPPLELVPPPPPPAPQKPGKLPPVAEAPRAPTRDALGFPNLALMPEARAAASSCLAGYAIHQIRHLNDGYLGNAHSWISQGEPSWAEIDLGGVYWIYRVAFASDAAGQYNDRAATSYSILASLEYDPDSRAACWTLVYQRRDGPPVRRLKEFLFKPVQARWVRIGIEQAAGGEVRLDEIAVFGQSEPITLDLSQALAAFRAAEETEQVAATASGPALWNAPPPPQATRRVVEPVQDYAAQVRMAFLGEEYAWLKTWGYADYPPALIEPHYRIPRREHPEHVGDDRLPLPPLPAVPRLDGWLDDAAWLGASRGVVRVADPRDAELSPLVECAVTAGWRDDDLYLALETDRLLSAHLAVVSAGEGESVGVVVLSESGIVLQRYARGQEVETVPLDAGMNQARTRFEVRLPLALLPGCRETGLRVGLGMGGRWTAKEGRPIHFVFAPLAVAEQTPCVGNSFRVRLALAAGADPVLLRGNAPELEEGLQVTPGTARTLTLPVEPGPIGPQFSLEIEAPEGQPYRLHLLRYDPVERTLDLMEALAARLADQGVQVATEREQIVRLRARQRELLSRAAPDRAAERRLLLEAREAKRGLFFRQPGLAPLEKVLFVKRHPFQPSHNYSDLFDSRWKPGGGIYLLRTPRRGDRLEPGEAEAVRLFDAGEGVARNPMADFDLRHIYFAWRPSEAGYYHVFRMNPDGSDLRRLTEGPFHDFWPCPLPDGGLAFISTRCRRRFLCWRPQTAVMHRMDADGDNIRPLSFSNLTEWAPSVMNDGRILWTRSEYQDKGADYGHTLWAIRPDGTHPDLVFGNTIMETNGFANGREVPGTNEVCCTLISHFGDLNGPIVLLDLDQGRFNPKAISSLTPEVPWPGASPLTECFREAVPLTRDLFLCAHSALDPERFHLYVLDRFGNRELLYADPAISSLCPTPFRARPRPPALPVTTDPHLTEGEFLVTDVYQGLEPAVKRGQVKYLSVSVEVADELEQLPNGEYRKDHEDFMKWYASPVDVLSGPFGWTSYVVKESLGTVSVEEDGSAWFRAPAGRVLYFHVLDKDFNELQRMRSVVQLQPGERRSCIGCHENRQTTTLPPTRPQALAGGPRALEPPPWGSGPFSYERVVQPVLDARCVGCHNARHPQGLDFSGTLDGEKVPASYRTLISKGLVHHADWQWVNGGCEKAPPLSLGTVKSRLWQVLDAGHHDVRLSLAEMRALKTWIDLNCPLWPDYIERRDRQPFTPSGPPAWLAPALSDR